MSSYGLVFFRVPKHGIRLGKLKGITSGQINAELIHGLELDSDSEPTPYLRSIQDYLVPQGALVVVETERMGFHHIDFARLRLSVVTESWVRQ